MALLPHIGAPPDRTVDNPDGNQDVIRFGNNASAPNGMAFHSDGSLFVSDSFQGAIFQIENADICSGSCAVTTFVHDALLATAGFPPFGADGIAFDPSGHLWVASNQADEVVVLNGNGRAVAILGDFLGFREDGAPRGLLFPASIVFSRDSAFVTNLALPLTPAVGDEPEEDVRVYTISRIKMGP
ncbi:MAG: SMP-30/gluconolactonase/LRE family protein [Candidatus Deferrimicrobium sp.]